MGLAAPYRLSCFETGKRMWDGVLLLNLLLRCVCVLQVWAAVQPSITEPPPAFRRVWVGQAGGRALNGARPVSMEEALTTGPALCPNHKVRPGSARASQLCVHTSVRVCVGAELKCTLLTSDSDVFAVCKDFRDVLFSPSCHTFSRLSFHC